MAPTISWAANANSFTFTVQGILVNSNTNVPYSGTVTFDFQIFDPSGTSCLLYEESQTTTLASDGLFSLNIGSDTANTAAKRVTASGHDRGLSMSQVFANVLPSPVPYTCYNP